MTLCALRVPMKRLSFFAVVKGRELLPVAMQDFERAIYRFKGPYKQHKTNNSCTMVKLSFSLALFALLPNSVLGVKDYSCCKKECDNQDYDESFGDNQQKCRDIDVNPLNGGVCNQGAPYWTRGLSYPCKKVICCTEDNCKGACTEDRHVSGGCTEDNKFVCDGKHCCMLVVFKLSHSVIMQA